jgi:hypothetical protein
LIFRLRNVHYEIYIPYTQCSAFNKLILVSIGIVRLVCL